MIPLFSQQFAREIWSKKAIELSTDFIPFSDNQLLSALHAYTHSYDKIRFLNNIASVNISINGEKPQKPSKDFLVLDTDHTLDDYISRIDKIIGNDDWSLMYFGLSAADPRMWDAAKIFSDKLATSIGKRPGGRVDVDCFIGRYSCTHAGIHTDYAHNFAYTLRNGKTMYTWPKDRLDLVGLKYPHYEKYKCESIALKNNTGCVAYFPHDFMHVAETKENISVNVNLAFWEYSSAAKDHADHLRKMISIPQRTHYNIIHSGLVNLNPDDQLQLSTLDAILKNGHLKKYMASQSLIMDTSSRIGIARPPIEVVNIRNNIHLEHNTTLQWIILLESEEILISANGHCICVPYRISFLKIMHQLVNRETVNLTEFSNHEKEYQEILRFIKSLACWKAIC
ncbi:hypothetical protein X471_00160 [Bartonella bacilliformis str. Heidi Mejia]|uniref:JmjC domain-containing protein n=2 Tax=Bartonella bacilliformis TaxID=774 RepID=A1UT76_BARBK|nr:hypothetical protein [Bartonella bacilliformis]ABM45530.1 conserved hypothetical protein [Bartonella bacilliformis KC583]AMG85956.1 hypothetical protein AL467_04280 [Bartonella bacilliformis]EKS43635.1 hypothetical protein BbINS_04225 [Bartonella bacilliformis INS]EYS89729.1 hypothetical protein X472_00163 [Bartonella bacilliformis San Pedro600-02]EYS92475.1 hypothetical protein X471_00160 [Bartonella bacilliformis str. Heidi Mejia]